MASTKRRTSDAVYEKFQPVKDFMETPEVYFLYIHLPGFTREQIKISYVDSKKSLSISGEKPTESKKWINFQEEIDVPSNCEVNRIQGKFVKETLTVTMPKKFSTQVDPTYEEFHPEVSNIENPDAYIWQVYVPGFPEDKLEVRYKFPTKTVIISGEKSEADNKCSRFSEIIHLHENCELSRLHAKLDQEILTVTVPKKVITPVVPKEELRASKEEISQDPSIGAAYEEFQPKSKITGNRNAYHLQIHLPGFTRDQAKIEYVTTKTLRISGEKPEIGNKWSRFSEAFPVPEDYEVDRIENKFVQGILTITIPKKIITLVVPKEQKTSKQEISQDPSHEDEKSQNQSVMKESVPTYSGKVLPALRKQTEEKTVVADARKERATMKEVKESYEEPSESRNPKKGLSGIEEKESKEDNQCLAKVTGYSPPRTSKREKETTGKVPAGNEGKCKKDMIEAARKGIKDESTAATMALKGMREGTLEDEEKNLLLNMGAAAVAVIAALGVYVSYRFVSSEKS
ncbi:hypothetical protein L6164_023293 [Bauhinia variegata]|uniref:Uncharacterized protein n=1 Tax=Bauhinia variegata TaxID=167791 RepID=A0ACB9MI79_BAUVA|nr:hypothetical protein L6164_023293 [Bauhinia variegata]